MRAYLVFNDKHCMLVHDFDTVIDFPMFVHSDYNVREIKIDHAAAYNKVESEYALVKQIISIESECKVLKNVKALMPVSPESHISKDEKNLKLKMYAKFAIHQTKTLEMMNILQFTTFLKKKYNAIAFVA